MFLKQPKWMLPLMVIYIVIAIILLFGKITWFPGFYRAHFMGFMALAGLFLMMLPPIVMRSHTHKHKILIQQMQYGLAFIMVTNAVGELGAYQLYKYGIQFDKILHFLIPLVSTVILARTFCAWRNISIRRAAILSALIVLGVSVGWEVFEYVCDRFIHTQEMGEYGAGVWWDTEIDLLMDVVGVLLGAGYVCLKQKK